MEDRKQQEATFHNFLRGKELAESNLGEKQYYTSNKKFYSVARAGTAYVSEWLQARVRGKRVLDYACGDGDMSFRLAELGAKQAVGIYVSEVSVGNCRREAASRGVDDRCLFMVMDAEAMTFPDNDFDHIVVSGVLHHLDVHKAFPELARVLRPDGAVMCLEALGHNPVFQLYRWRTPHLRTAWETEHIIRRRDLELARNYFEQIETRFFYATVFLAVPFRQTPLFQPLLRLLEGVDSVLMRLPVVQWQAWMIWFALSQPIKHRKE